MEWGSSVAATYDRDISISLDCAVFPTCPLPYPSFLSHNLTRPTAARKTPAAPVLSDHVRLRPRPSSAPLLPLHGQ